MVFPILLLLASLIAAVVGLLKPSLVLPAKAKPTRLKALTVYGILFIVSFITVGNIARRPEVQAQMATDKAERQIRAEKEKLAQDQERARADQEREEKAAREAAEQRTEDELQHPEKNVTVKILWWEKGGFGTVMIADFAVKNDNPFPVKDLDISCDVFGNSDTKIGSTSKTLYELVAPNKAATFKQVGMGFITDQAATVRCEVRTAKVAG